MSTAIELRGVSFTYAGSAQKVLDQVDLKLDYGEFMVLSGVSGEGKTTLLSVINGVIPFINGGELSGDVFLDGKRANEMHISARSRLVGSVLQNADEQIVHDLTEDEVAFGCENLKYPPQQIETAVHESLRQMKLEAHWPTKTLSGGQKQRLITAATLAMRQKILVLDEPLANLDKEGGALLLNRLKDLTRLGFAVLLVEHRLDVVLPYADSVIWLKNGRLFRSDDPSTLLKNSREKLYAQPECTLPAQDVCIEAQHIAFSVRDRSILNDVSVAIRAGERIVLLGENGCGKTTLLRILARLTKPTGGRIVQNILPGDKKKKAGSAWFKKVGFVYQNPSYQLFMPTLLEEIAYQAVSAEKAQEMIERFGLAGLEKRHPHSLSEGQKRRAGIAAVMAGEPQVVLLDEPTVGQDYDNLKQTVETLNDLHRQTGNTMITVTHDFRCAAALADRVLILENGQITESGASELADAYFKRNM